MKKVFLIGLVFLFSILMVFAAPPLPHAFEGEIFVEDGSLTSGRNLTTSLNGAVTGKTTIEGNSFKITVIDNLGSGGVIEFFIGDEKADLSFPFEAFEVTKTDLTFDTIPNETIGSCGDGICAVEECSFCAIDCPISSCNNNNVCDVLIGEDYITAPNDCSSCGDGFCNNGETCSTCPGDCGCASGYTCTGGICVANTGGSSSGGSSSSSGGSSPSIALTANNNVNLSFEEEENDSEIKTIEDLNKEQEETQDTTGFLSTITGAVTGVVGTAGGVGIIVFMVLVCGGFVAIRIRKKKD